MFDRFTTPTLKQTFYGALIKSKNCLNIGRASSIKLYGFVSRRSTSNPR